MLYIRTYFTYTSLWSNSFIFNHLLLLLSVRYPRTFYPLDILVTHMNIYFFGLLTLVPQ